jgi:hypothetical protein
LLTDITSPGKKGNVILHKTAGSMGRETTPQRGNSRIGVLTWKRNEWRI